MKFQINYRLKYNSKPHKKEYTAFVYAKTFMQAINQHIKRHTCHTCRPVITKVIY